MASAPDRGDRPSRHGRLMGEMLANLADAGAALGLAERCATCAFRRGTLANMSAGTGLTAWKCAIGVDPDPFACHHGMKDGQPTRECAGYEAARRAPFDRAREAGERLLRVMRAAEGDDEERAAFDVWAARIDPDFAMDVYQLGRAWERARAAQVDHG